MIILTGNVVFSRNFKIMRIQPDVELLCGLAQASKFGRKTMRDGGRDSE